MRNVVEEVLAREIIYFDSDTKKYMKHMCRKCKFFDAKCQKGRMVRDCAEQNLKNKE